MSIGRIELINGQKRYVPYATLGGVIIPAHHMI